MNARHELNYNLFVRKTNEIKRLPLNKEEENFINICRGNVDAVSEENKNIEKIFIPDSRIFSDNNLRNAMFHFVLYASDISRACINNGMGHDEAYTLADIYIKKADTAQSLYRLAELLAIMRLDFTKRMQEIKKENVISLHIRKCIDYIYEHLGEKLSVNNLAEHLGLNPSYLSKLFINETGQKLKNFITEAKIDTAENLLKFSDLSYLDISVALGFSTQSLFISAFKKVTGLTPKKYREKFYISET